MFEVQKKRERKLKNRKQERILRDFWNMRNKEVKYIERLDYKAVDRRQE